MSLHRAYTDPQLTDIVRLGEKGKTFSEIAEYLKKHYGVDRSLSSIRHAYNDYRHILVLKDGKVSLDHLKEMSRTKRTASKHAKENRVLLEAAELYDNLISNIEEMVATIKLPKIDIAKWEKFDKKKHSMTKELLLSDLHFGKKTDTFDLEVAISRCEQLVYHTIRDIKRDGDHFNIDRLIIAMLGDMIESYTMHGLESARGCEFDNAEQVQRAIEVLFKYVLVPFAKTGIRIDVICVAGNHDRTEAKNTFHKVGRTNLTYIIYSTLQMLCQVAGLKNITFRIPDGPYAIEPIYKNHCLYEHGDLIKACTAAALENHLHKRQAQTGVVLDFIRIGHFHAANVFEHGRGVSNGSLPGSDSYSEALGYNSKAGQMLISYVETDTRPTCFYRSFPIYLD